jgi:hypothetical protein
MNVAILDDYLGTLRTLDCFRKLEGHRVTVFTEHVDDDGSLAERLSDAEALVLIRVGPDRRVRRRRPIRVVNPDVFDHRRSVSE